MESGLSILGDIRPHLLAIPDTGSLPNSAVSQPRTEPRDMIKSAKKLSAAAIALGMLSAVSACMTATPYQAYEPELTAGVHGGFSEQRIAPDRYRVRFHGNELTSRDRVEGYMLYRAAELAVQNGYDWFTIIDRHTEHDVQTMPCRTPSIVHGMAPITVTGGRTGAIISREWAGTPGTRNMAARSGLTESISGAWNHSKPRRRSFSARVQCRPGSPPFSMPGGS